MTTVSVRTPDALVARVDAVARAATAAQDIGSSVKRSNIIVAAVERGLPLLEAQYGIVPDLTPTEAPPTVGRPKATTPASQRIPPWLAPHVPDLGKVSDAEIGRMAGRSAAAVKYWRALLP